MPHPTRPDSISTRVAICFVLVLLLAIASASAAEPFRLPRIVEGTLDNGLRVVVCPRPGAGLVDVRVALRVGSWLEGEFQGTGISHYYEHVVVSGTTPTRSSDDAKRMVRSIGGQLQARTDTDRTWFSITTTPDGMGTAVDLLADWMQRCSLKEEEVTREKGVILSELDQYADQAPRRAWELVHAIAFTRHPARLPTQGSRAAFQALTRSDLVKFFESRYVPGNAVVAVVGDVDAGQAYNAVRAAFSGWKRVRAPEAPAPEALAEPPWSGRRFAAARLPSAPRAAVALAFPTVALRHPDKPALDVLRAVISSGRQARLNVRLSGEPGGAASASVWSRTPALGGGLFLVLGDVPPDRADRFEQTVLDELAKIGADGPSDDEVESAKRRMRAESVTSLESVSELAQTLSRDQLQTGDCRYEERYQAEIAQVTAADVKRVAAAYLTTDRLAVAVVGPRVDDDGGAPAASDEAAPEETNAPAPASSPVPLLATLGNGASIVIEPRAPGDTGSGGLVICVALGGGPLREAREISGATSVLVELLARGGRPEVEALLRRIESSGGAVSTNVSVVAATLTVRVLPEDLALALEYLGAALAQLEFSPAAIQMETERAKARAESRTASFADNAVDRLLAVAFGGSPYALPPYGGAESLARLAPDAMAAFARTTVCGANLSVVVAGAAGPADAVVAAAEQTFAALATGERAALPKPAAPSLLGPEGKGREVTVEIDRGQATVLLAWPGFAVDAERERAALDLLDAFWSGRAIASGPLYDALRGGTADLAYYVHAEHRSWPGAGLFYAIAQCAPEKYPQVLAAMKDSAAKLGRDGLTTDDLKVARNVWLADRMASQQTLEARARTRATSVLIDRPLDAETRYRARAAALTAAEVNELGKSLAGEPLLLVLWPKGVAKP